MKFYAAECLDDEEQRAHIVSFTRSCRIVDGEGPKYSKQCWQHPESTGLTPRTTNAMVQLQNIFKRVVCKKNRDLFLEICVGEEQDVHFG